MSWDIFSKSKIQYFLQKLKDKFVQKETGKGLSTNDFDNTYKSKVDKIDVSLTSVSGNPISISGLKANQLAINPIITLEPIQAGSGTPSPSNIRAISGYDKIEVLSCGKNLFDIDKVIRNSAISVSGNNISITPVGYNTDLFSGNTGESGASAKKLYLKAGTYAISFSFVGTAPQLNSIYVNTIDETTLIPNGNIGRKTSGQTFVITESSWICLKLVINSTCTLKDIQIEESSSATTYVPYHKTTDLLESLGQTVYAGTYNPRTGVFTATHAKKRLEGNDTWTGSNKGINAQLAMSDMKSGDWYNDGVSICDTLEKVSTLVAGKTTIKIGNNNTTVYLYNMALLDDTIESQTALNNYLANHPIEFTYPLANPIEIQLTPHEISLLKDYAYVSTNGTTIALDYHNGEIASLSDVAQLSETVERLTEYIKGLINNA